VTVLGEEAEEVIRVAGRAPPPEVRPEAEEVIKELGRREVLPREAPPASLRSRREGGGVRVPLGEWEPGVWGGELVISLF
jgi:hypothetical protein